MANQGKNARKRESHGPDSAINQAATAADEEPPFAISTREAPPISEPDHPLRDADVHRAPADVLRDHLECSQSGTVDADLTRNFADDIVVLTSDGSHKGPYRCAASRKSSQTNSQTLVSPTGMSSSRAEWACSSGPRERWRRLCRRCRYLIEGGRIVYQTIHYTARQR